MKTADLVSVSLLEGWVDLSHGDRLAFAPATDVTKWGPKLSELPLVFAVMTLPSVASVSTAQLVENLMTRRVRQGSPAWFSATVDGVATTGCGWTDGITDILSWFAVHPQGPLVELSLYSLFGATGRSNLSDADALLACVHWK